MIEVTHDRRDAMACVYCGMIQNYPQRKSYVSIIDLVNDVPHGWLKVVRVADGEVLSFCSEKHYEEYYG